MGTLARLLELRPIDDTLFEAPVSPEAGGVLFGGQLLAQALRAAQHTTGGDRLVHSLHASFLRPGDVSLPVELRVERVRDGRAFSSRQISAWQGEGRELFRMMASFQVADLSPGYVAAVMPEVPPPEEVVFTYDDFCAREMGGREWLGVARPLDIRYINPPQQRGTPVTEGQLMWMRIPDALPDGPGLHQAALAYLSDATLIDHVMLPHGLRWQDADFEGASLDHAMWFHRAAAANDWLLFEQRVEWTGQGRGLASGRLFDAAGNLVSTCIQEGLMRWKTS